MTTRMVFGLLVFIFLFGFVDDVGGGVGVIVSEEEEADEDWYVEGQDFTT